VRTRGPSATIRECQPNRNRPRLTAALPPTSTPPWLLPALAIASLRDDVPERGMLCAWLDSWSGAREVIDAMNGHGYDVAACPVEHAGQSGIARPMASVIPR
jgi:hypothetical protein